MVRRLITLAAVLGSLVLLGRAARELLGIEASPEAIRTWVQGFGWWAPAVYVGLLTFRHFFILPSSVLLTVGGICFGAALGGALGTVGVFFTGILEFTLLRTVKPAWLVVRARRTEGSFARRAVERGASAAVIISTAVPASPMSVFHWAAAFTRISYLSFAVALAIGAAARSFSLSYFGSGLVAAGTRHLVVAGAILALLMIVPMAHPGLRRRLLPPPD